MWQADRSRYMAGHACNWRRLLGYHAFGTGISPRSISTPLATGEFVHAALEAVLTLAETEPEMPVTRESVTEIIAPVLARYRQHAAGTDLPIDEQCALVEGITHAYSRIALPWMTEQFDFIQIEKEGVLQLPEVQWMFRPDFVTRHRETGAIAVHDFKTSSSWNEDRDVGEYRDSVQMMMNAHGVQQQLGEPVSYYYIHILLKGNDYAPSPLIYPYVRLGNPPLYQHDYQAYYKYTKPDGSTGYLGRNYSRTPVWQSRPVDDWVWSMPEADCAKQIILIGPYEVNQLKVDRFVRGLQGNEGLWAARLMNIDWSQWKDPAFQRALDHKFPRTYQCYTYGTRCSYYDLCHQREGWQDPLGPGGRFEPREPHHTTEVVDV